MRPILVALILMAVAACGADGEPEPRDAPPGVSISGSVEFGVTGSF